MPENKTVNGLLLLPDERCMPKVASGMGLVSAAEGKTLAETAVEAMQTDQANGHAPQPGMMTERTVNEADEAAWRGAVAVALLGDCWAEDLLLRVLRIEADSSAFARSALFASDRDELLLAALEHHGQTRVLGLLNREQVLSLPATGESWLENCPERIAWVDGETGRLTDPCRYLTQRDRHVLAARLRPMQQCDAVRRFIDDLQAVDEAAVKAALHEAGNTDWPTVMKVLVGLSQESGFEALEAVKVRDAVVGVSPVLSALNIQCNLTGQEPEQRLYTWHDQPFARTNAQLGLEPLPGKALDDLRDACELLETYSRRFDRDLALRLGNWVQSAGLSLDLEARTKLLLLQGDSQEKGVTPAEPLTLTWPWHTETPALSLLLRELLGGNDVNAVLAPFADKLVLMSGAVLGDPVLNRVCSLFADGAYWTALPPLSAMTANHLLLNPELRVSALNSLRLTVSGGAIEVSMTLSGPGQVCLKRVYPLEETLRWADNGIPEVSLWPSVPVDPKRWKRWYMSIRGDVTLSFPQNGEWTRFKDAPEGMAEDGKLQPCRVYETNSMPGFAALHSGDDCLGILCYQAETYVPPMLGEATAALDLGATGTAMAVRVGGMVQGVSMPSLWHVMLRGPVEDLAHEALPVWPLGPVVPSSVLLTDDSDDADPFVNGRICADQAMSELRTGEKAPCTDLMWRIDPEAVRARRLLLRETMLAASFHAVMSGAETVSWLVNLPQTMAQDGRRRLLEECREAAGWAERTTGLPQSAGSMVQTVRENQAVANYLRESGVARGAYAMLNLGGSDAAMTLWLRGNNKPAAEFQLHMGVASMLLTALTEQPALLQNDFADVLLPGEMLLSDPGSGWDAWSRRRLLLDDVLGLRLPQAMDVMTARFYEGRMTNTMALLLLGLAELMALTGTSLEQTRQNTLLNDYLPPDLALCLCGRGSLVFSGMDARLRQSLMGFVRLMMSADHPIRAIRLTSSPAPKMEAALGLAYLQKLPENASPALSPLSESREVLNLLARFLGTFAMSYPQAAILLFPGLLAPDGMFSELAEDRVRQAAYQSRGTVQERFVWGVELVRSMYAADLEAERAAQRMQQTAPAGMPADEMTAPEEDKT